MTNIEDKKRSIRTMYICKTCGPVGDEYHDGREGECLNACIPEGECLQAKGNDIEPSCFNQYSACYWYGENGQTAAWYEPHPDHERLQEDSREAQLLIASLSQEQARMEL